eukprot:PLAT16176.2.p1 GENE.PLAT16176.2~~PLAT16176.2.p1  ORF type:complete len:712 (+),score=213.52 PLAT16176.2:937-3072(+)
MASARAAGAGKAAVAAMPCAAVGKVDKSRCASQIFTICEARTETAMSDARPDTLLQRMAHWVAEHGDSPLFRFCDDSGKLVKGYTYAEMDEETTRLAALLRSPEGYDLEVGERVLLVFPPGLDFIVSYLSCMRAGLIPVPVFPPDPRKLKKDLYLFTCIHASCGAAIALTNSTYGWAKRVQKIKARFTRDDVDWPDDLHWLVIDNAPKVPVAGYEDHVADYDDVAFLQYTSGSTSEPKGVMVTHRALSHNLQVIVKSLRADESTVVVSWLPQYHDMGLIGSYLGALYCGGQGVYMSPFSFIKNPPLWMTLVNEYRGTHLQGPNFAYGLTARKWASRVRAGKLSEDGVDLSCVRHVFNAAEPVTQESIDAFLETFVPLGFPADSMVPGYGLAEHTVYVCDGHGPSGKLHIMQDTLEGDSRLEFSDEAKEGITLTLVGCGVPSNNADIDVRIVQPDSCRERGDAYVGEIWIHSESKAAGYWEDEERSQKEFHGMLVEGDDGDEKEGDGDGDGDGDGKKEEETAADEGRAEAGRPPASPAGYLRTGDLGFLYKGELFVCGRIKDLIIIRGRNHYPQDLEIMMEQNSELRGGCSAAFSVRVRGEEALVLMSEVRDPKSTDLDALVEDVRVRITRGFGVKPYAILLLAPRTSRSCGVAHVAACCCSVSRQPAARRSPQDDQRQNRSPVVQARLPAQDAQHPQGVARIARRRKWGGR